MEELSYYEILEVSQSADKSTIKKAYRAMAKKYHPDKVAGYEEKMKVINNLCDMLLNARLQIQHPVAVRYYTYSAATSYTSSTTTGSW